MPLQACKITAAQHRSCSIELLPLQCAPGAEEKPHSISAVWLIKLSYFISTLCSIVFRFLFCTVLHYCYLALVVSLTCYNIVCFVYFYR